MNILLFLTSVIMFAVFAASLVWVAKKRKSNKKFLGLILGIAVTNFVTGLILCLFSISKINFTKGATVILVSLVITIQTISLISIISKIQHNKKIRYSIFLLIIALIPISLNNNYIHILIPTSLLITIMTFLTYTEDHESHISLLIAYASLSILFYIISFMNQKLIPIFFIISSSMFLVFYAEFLRFLKNPHAIKVSSKNASPLIPFLKHMVFIIIITNFVFVGTVSIHELGHIVSVKSSDCQDAKIVYDLDSFPHTEVKCANTSSRNNWIMAGIFLPLAVALLLIFGGGTSIKEIGLEIIGFDLAISYTDLQSLGFSQSVSFAVMLSGIAMATIGLILLTGSRTNNI